MMVNGTMQVQVDVSFYEALKVVLKGLSYNEDFAVLPPNNPHNTTKVEALYSIRDVSYHGSPDYEYKLISTDKVRIEAFKEAERLIELVKNKEFKSNLN